MRAKGRVLTRNMLLEKVWDMNFDPTTSVVETHVSRLRGKIEKPFVDTVMGTIRGVGYILTLKDKAAGLWRMTALRQTVLLMGLFILVLVGAGIFAAFDVRDEMPRRADDRLEARYEKIVDDIANAGLDPTSLQNTRLERFFFTPQAESDDQLYGRNGFFTDPRLLPGKSELEHGRNDQSVWMFYGGPVNGGWMVVGQYIGEFEVLMKSYYKLWPALVPSPRRLHFCWGCFFGWCSQKRISAISKLLNRAASGDLTARVGASGADNDLKRLSDQVDDAIARIDVLLRQTRNFSANIAHDLKTPLARLRIRLETAMTSDADPLDGIGAALEQTDRVIGIFDAILQLGKLESGVTKQTFAPVDLAALAAELADTYGPVIEDSGRSFETQIAPVTILGDRVLLMQFLANLVENALRHTPKGSALTLVANQRALGLIDNGPGIPAAQRDRALEPLYRLEKSRTSEGAGLGLALADKIAQLHGADIVLADNPLGPGLFAHMAFKKIQT